MDYEKLYNEALERAKKNYITAQDLCEGAKIGVECFKNTLESIFPELQESEDEMIRQELITHCRNTRCVTEEGAERIAKWIAWLGKKGKQKEYTFKSIPRLLDMIEPSDRAKAYCQRLIDTLKKEGYHTDAKIVGECLRNMNGENVGMAVMDGQPITDTVEPKFHEGEWITNGDYTLKIVEIKHDESK